MSVTPGLLSAGYVTLSPPPLLFFHANLSQNLYGIVGTGKQPIPENVEHVAYDALPR